MCDEALMPPIHNLKQKILRWKSNEKRINLMTMIINMNIFLLNSLILENLINFFNFINQYNELMLRGIIKVYLKR